MTGALVVSLVAVGLGVLFIVQGLSGHSWRGEASGNDFGSGHTATRSTEDPAVARRAVEPSAPIKVVVQRGREAVLTAKITPIAAADGVLNPPRDTVGWYADAGWPAPGQESKQNAVLVGHVSWAGEPDVFADLGSVRPGDVVLVTDSSHQTRRFVVDRGPEPIAKDQISGGGSDWIWNAPEGSRALTLITCDPASGVRTDGHAKGNLVVRARLS